MSNQFTQVTTEIFINRARKLHQGKYDYSKTIYKSSKENVIITCSAHGDFLQSPSNHYRCGCPRCGIESTASNKSDRLTTEKFIFRAKKIHGDKYDYSLVTYVSPWNKITVTCKEHGPFISNYLLIRGIGCPHCGREKSMQTRVSNGYAISPDQRTVYESYETRVNRITEYNYRHHKSYINPNNYKRARANGWQLDHRFSKQQGFIEGLLPEVIGHWTNLQMLSAAENREKSMSCSISKQQLLEDYSNSRLLNRPFQQE